MCSQGCSTDSQIINVFYVACAAHLLKAAVCGVEFAVNLLMQLHCQYLQLLIRNPCSPRCLREPRMSRPADQTTAKMRFK